MLRLFIVFFLFFSLSAKAQSLRPKVGLVLSGGSAHGLAHIGVLKYLDKAGIKVDYITGTSMGAVIGALHAIGYDADEIEIIAEKMEWELLMSNHSPLNEVSPAEKSFHDKIPLSLLWNHSSFKFPLGLIQGQKLDVLISSIFSPAYFIDDFNDLPIPYKCVAVDLEDGSVKVFDSGYLGDAVRASMAIPSVFPPKELNDRIYVDGGLLRNFPVQENKAMGSDVIIGVYVGSKKEKRDKLNSLFEVLKQSASMASLLDYESQSKMVDILIEPDVKEFGTFDFSKPKKYINQGYIAAEEQEKALKSLADSLSQFKPELKKLKLLRPEFIEIDEIKSNEKDPVFQKMIKNRLKFQEGRVLLDEIEHSISLIYGSKNYSKASYSFFKTDKAFGVDIDTKEVNPYTVGLGINRFKQYNTSFILSGEARNVFGKASRVRVDARLSENPGLQFNYLLRFPTAPSFFANLNGTYDRHNLPFYSGKIVDRLYKNTEIKIGLSLNKEWKNSHLFSLGYNHYFEFFKPKVFKSNDIKKYRTIQDEIYLRLNYNSLDRLIFATEGILLNIRLSGFFNNRLKRTNQSEEANFLPFEEDKHFVSSDVNFAYYIKSSNLLCHEFLIKSRISTGESFTRNYKIGGPLQEKDNVYGFLGLDDSELIAGDHLSFRYGLRFQIKSALYIIPAIQYFNGDNYLSYAFNEDVKISFLSYGIIFGFNTPIGPLVLDIGYADKTDRMVVNFGIGYRHIL